MSNLSTLIIEDDSVIAIDIMNVLEKMNLTVVGIVDEEQEALDIASNKCIDLVISDINLNKKKDGVDICTKLQTIYNLPVIFVTGCNDDQTLIKASSVRSEGFLLKPFREIELETLIKLTVHKYDMLKVNRLIQLGEYYYDKESKQLFLNNEEISLTKKEQSFVSLLSNYKNNVIPYTTLDSFIWKEEFVSENARRVFIYRVSKKLEKIRIETEKSLGICIYYK